jgi:LIVCS family branched-chain amino acid:cation transporter
MNKTKEIIITGFALFSLFFGAGDLILPPYLGFNTGKSWILVALGFAITAVMIPVLGLLAHAKLQGTMYDFGKKVSPRFSLAYCLIVYVICVLLPAPRTASVTHEMAIVPFFDTSPLLTSSIYFGLVLLFVINRSKIIDVIGKFLTPLIIIILLIIIFIGIFTSPEVMLTSRLETPLVSGLLEGYQTYGAIGSVVVGGVVIISLNLKGTLRPEDKKNFIMKSALVAGFGLFIIYTGLILIGAVYSNTFSQDVSRTSLLSGLSTATLGSMGTALLSVLVALACFTTAVGIVTGTADYFKGLFKESQIVYTLTAVMACVLGIIMGQFNVGFIIDIAIPALMFIYPITIILIVLNILPDKYASPLVFKTVVLITFLFSVSDFLKFLIPVKKLQPLIDAIPFANYSLGWVLPAVTTFILVNFLFTKKA